MSRPLRDHLEAELAHCRLQRDEARGQIALAQQQIAQAQQFAQTAERNIERCNGGEAQLLALIAKLDEEGTDAKPPA